MSESSSDTFVDIKGVMFDIDGVLYVGDDIIPGADRAVGRVKAARLPVRFTTNTTTRSQEDLFQKLTHLGLPVFPEEVFGVLQAARDYLRERGNPVCRFLLTDSPRRDFVDSPHSERNPEVLVIGDVGKDWSYDLMDDCFNQIMDGAELVALHKGRYWQVETGLRMDIGAFVAGLEYVTGKEAVVIGKPSAEFFNRALADMKLEPEQVVMVGDDIVNDIDGAQKVGMKTILVRTGKYRADIIADSGITPDMIIDSVIDLPEVLGLEQAPGIEPAGPQL